MMFNSSWTILLSCCSTCNDTSSLVLFQTNCEIFHNSWIRFHGYLPGRQRHIITVDTFCGSPTIYRFPWRQVRHCQPHYIFSAPDDILQHMYYWIRWKKYVVFEMPDTLNSELKPTTETLNPPCRESEMQVTMIFNISFSEAIHFEPKPGLVRMSHVSWRWNAWWRCGVYHKTP